ncbi:phospholipase D-like domain-containing protein [Pseudomonas putida]|uniref:phospholipase D-like domain-containing protein n=1 Tax=Pseudomonas putida TaxID=303 RepID=UPI0018D62938|nr:phospholipase D-like domain-containing protein [Pseudomonas putida]MBH3412702.1 hypothetical protein [Pseudomonas putida]
MNILNIAVPVIKGKAKFIIDKGHPWSAIEHLLLHALSLKKWSITELASHSDLPRRVVMESIIRLMRAGWVELKQDASETLFTSTVFGSIALDRLELPTILERKDRPTNFIVDLLSGNVFRNREWAVFTEQNIRERAQNENFIILNSDSEDTSVDVAGMLDILLDPDEIFVSAEPKGVIRRYVVVTVKDGIMHGLPPKRDLPELKNKILEIYRTHYLQDNERTAEIKVPGIRLQSLESKEEFRKIRFNTKDLILGGNAHLDALLYAIRNSKSKIIIHSTFIEEDKLSRFLPDLIEAAKRGVTTHIFWGQNELAEETASSRRAITSIYENRDLTEFSNNIIIHPHSTGSHSKFIISDSGSDGSYTAIIGSCNWFTSSFSTYEASILLRDPSIVRDILSYTSRLCCIHDGIWSDLATEIALIGQKIACEPTPAKTNATASLIIGDQHNSYIYKARDEAKKNILLTSHRLGGTLYSAALPALQKAVKEKSVTASIYFNQATHPVSNADLEKVIKTATEQGITLKMVANPKLHAKILAWDNDHILISSLNWLSADPKGSDNLKELGIYIEFTGSASFITEDISKNLAS